MAGIVIVILLVLYFFGYIRIPGLAIPNPLLFTFNGHPILLSTLLIFLVIMWAIGVLPSPIRQIAGVLFVLWILAELGFIAIAGLSSLLVIAILVGLLISLFQ
jgi:hypothetical protein